MLNLIPSLRSNSAPATKVETSEPEATNITSGLESEPAITYAPFAVCA